MGLVGSFAPILINLVATSVAEHSFIADTISDLGRGPHKWIMDNGFYINAAGLLALAVAAAHAHLGKWSWSLGIFCLLFAALVTVLLGVWDKFGGTDDMSVHTMLTFFLAPLYLIGPLLMMPAFWQGRRRVAWSFAISAVLWIIFGAAFKLAPTNIDGLLEKIAFVGTLFWTVPLSWVMFRRGVKA